MNEQEAKKIFESYIKIKQLAHDVGNVDFELAKELYYQKSNNRYKTILGYDEATWRNFLRQEELRSISPSKADRLIKIYETYIIKLELSPKDLEGLDTNCLQRLASTVTKKNVRSWFEKMRNAPKEIDTREYIYRLLKFGDKNQESCRHSLEFKKVGICSKCGYRETTTL